ncbi:hypothetical protein NZK35_23505 [Stieleria sp. ICT_E10.1]|uniref:hypothetical protein n=1 Tax=Stieleria sedimenti TaxID=2976331 RepID=UPI002180750D|nr:hypothetical protein [Stieleria sedimenti]MCS7469628.1 hypothetical protein [Stieleria sedimenti]
MTLKLAGELMGKFIHIRSSKFPILPGEKEELVNDGMYGKSLAQYLQSNLEERGYDAPFVCCEDWGWWVELTAAPFTFGACVYSGAEENVPRDFACTDGVIGPRKWSWKKLQFVDTSPWVDKLIDDMIAIFQADEDIEIVDVSEEFPDLDASTGVDQGT